MEEASSVTGGVRMGEYVLIFEEDDVTEAEFVEKAKVELRETSDIKEKALEEFKRLIQSDSKLNVPLSDNDTFFRAFLRSCKHYPESAFLKMKMMYKFRQTHPRYFGNVVPVNEKNVFENNLLTVSPRRDQHGRRVLILELGNKWNTASCTLVEITRGILLVIEAAILEPKTQISGAVLIMDLGGLTVQHVLHFTPKYAKMVLEWLQDCMPLRIKAVHIVNQPYIFNMAFAVFKPFMREKLRNRIYLHGMDQSSLLNHIDPKFTPIRFGGLLDIPLDEGLSMWKFLCQHNDRYEKTSKYGYTNL